MPLPLAEYRNFLLLQYPLALGTAIHATPVIPAIHASIPGARIAAAASGFAREILMGNPGIERLISTPSPLRNLRGAARALRQAKPFGAEPYAILQTAGSERTRVTVAAMLSGGHTRIGHSVLPKLSAAPLSFDPRLSQIANNLRIIEVLGHGAALINALKRDPELLEPQVFPTDEHNCTAKSLLTKQGIDLTRPIAIFVTQTSITQRKSWRAERFQSVAQSLYQRYGMQIVFVGTAEESAAIDAIRSGLPFSTVNVAGQTPLLILAALMGMADIALTLDTGPMHLLRAARVPTVIIAPAWSPPVEWLPLGNPRARILKNADMDEAPDDYIIDEVSVAEVERNLDELLAIYPPRTRQA